MKKIFTLTLCALLVCALIFTVTTQAKAESVNPYSEAEILDKITMSWMTTCLMNRVYCEEGMAIYALGKVVPEAETYIQIMFTEMNENISNIVTETPAIKVKLEKGELEELCAQYGTNSLLEDIQTYTTYVGAEMMTEEWEAAMKAFANINETLDTAEVADGVDIGDIIKENYAFMVGKICCEIAYQDFQEAKKATNLAEKRMWILKGVRMATYGCEMSIGKADDVAKGTDLQKSPEDIMVDIAEASIDVVSEIAPEVGIIYDSITFTMDIGIKLLSIQDEMDTMAGFLNWPQTIDEDKETFYNIISNQYDRYTYEIIDGEITLDEYNGYLHVGTDYATVNVPSEIYGFPVVAFGGTLADGLDITSVEIPATIRSRSLLAVISDCDKLRTVKYNAVNCKGWYLHYFFEDCDSKFEIDIGEGVQVIPERFIARCGLTELEIPEGVTTIYNGAVKDCPNLETVTIPSTVTSFELTVSCPGVVDGCSKLKKVYYNAINAKGGYYNAIFHDCGNSVEEMELFIGNEVKVIPATFMNNCGVKTLTFPEGVTQIREHAVSGCQRLETITIPSTVTSFSQSLDGDYVFTNCNALETINYNATNAVGKVGTYIFYDIQSDFEVNFGSRIEMIPEDFMSKCGLTEIDFSQGIKSIGNNCLVDCDALETVTIPSTVETLGYYLIKDCRAIEDVYFNATCAVNSGTTLICDSGDFTTQTMQIWLGNNVTNVPAHFIENCAITQFVYPEGVKIINNYSLQNCSALKTVVIPTTVEQLGYKVISKCTNLECVNYFAKAAVNGNDTNAYTIWNCGNNEGMDLNLQSTVRSLPERLVSKAGIRTVNIPNGVTHIPSQFVDNCDNLKSITIPASVTTIGDDAFYNCHYLVEIYFNAGNMNDLGVNNGSFYSAGKKGPGITVSIGKNVQRIPAYLFCSVNSDLSVTNVKTVLFAKDSVCTEIGKNAFSYCTGLTSITLPSTITAIGSSAFSHCTSLPYIYIPDTVQTMGRTVFSGCSSLTSLHMPVNLTTIDDSMFYGCSSLTEIKIPENVTYIGTNAFEGCTSLKTLKIPSKVTTIDGGAFKRCTGITNLTIPASVTAMNYGAFKDCTGIVEIIFLGSATSGASSLSGVTATAYYPAADTSWTANKQRSYSGTITWIPYGEVPIEKFPIDAARMSLGNSLEFQFGVEKSKIGDITGVYAVIEKIGANGTVTKTVPATAWGTSGQYWTIAYNDLAAKEMADTFRVTIYNAAGKQISNVKTDSIRDYVQRSWKNQGDIGKTMMVDMLNYGAAAQIYFNYNTDDLANNFLTEDQLKWGTETAVPTVDYCVKGTNYKGSRLVLESNLQMQVAFEKMDRTMYAVYSYTDHNGDAQSVTVKGKDFVSVNGVYAVELNELVYADARQLVTIKIYNSKGMLLSTVQDSVESYVNRSGETKPLFNALMKFADSAKAYLHR